MLTIPYFYIIKHESSGRFYAGSRKAIRCNPKELLSENRGYQTSSKVVRKLIKNGDIFSIVLCLTEQQCGMDVYDFETLFLQTYSVSTNPMWINQHENRVLVHNSDKIKSMMITKYGFDHCMKVESLKTKRKEDSIKKYGVDHPMKYKPNIEKRSENHAKKYGVSNPMQRTGVQSKYKNSIRERYGVENVSMLQTVKDKKREISLSKTGYSSALQDPAKREEGLATKRKLSERPVIKKILSFLETRETRAKDVGMHNNWKMSSRKYLEAFCVELGIEVCDIDFIV